MKIQKILKKELFHQKKRRKIKRIKTTFTKIKHSKISNLFNDSTASEIATKKWMEVNDLSSGQSSVNKCIMLKTSMLESNLCDYIKGHIEVQ